MPNQQLANYIKQQLQQGISQATINTELLAKGWQVSDLKAEFDLIPQTTNSKKPTTSPNLTPVQSTKKSPKTLIILIVISAILIISGGALAYFYYFQSPKVIVQKMVSKLIQVKSAEYSGTIEIKVNVSNFMNASSTNGDLLQFTGLSINKKTSNFLINFTGAINRYETNKLRNSFSFDLKTNALQQELSLGLKIKSIGKVIYIELDDVPKLKTFNLEAIKNHWVKIDTGTVKKQLKVSNDTIGMSPKQILKSRAIAEKVFKLTEKSNNTKLNNLVTYHYKFIIEIKELKKLFINFRQTMQNKSLTKEELTKIDNDFETIKSAQGEIWIGKKDLLPYKLTLNLITKASHKGQAPMEIKFTILTKNFNQAIKINPPAQVKTLEELIGSLFGGFGNQVSLNIPQKDISPSIKTTATSTGQTSKELSMQIRAKSDINMNQANTNSQGLINAKKELSKTNTNTIDTDHDGLSDYQELKIYQTDPLNPDTDGDGYNDGAEVKAGYNPNGPGKLPQNIINTSSQSTTTIKGGIK